MSGDPRALPNGTERSGASNLLDSFERCPSEHAKTVFLREELIPWIQGKGEHSHCNKFDNTNAAIACLGRTILESEDIG